MSRIDDLVSELCPDGVERIALKDLTSQVSRISWSTEESQEYRYIDLSSVDLASGKIRETSIVDSAGAPSRAQQVVLDGDVIFATTRPTQLRCAVISRDFDGQIASTGYCVLRPREGEILTNYLAHCLRSNDFLFFLEKHQVPGNYPSISDRILKGYEIRLPPLPVQQEIVQILDAFTELEAELEAELEERGSQFDYYRNTQLTFGVDVPKFPLGEVATVVRGASPRPIKRFMTTADRGLPWIKIGDVPEGDKYITHTSEFVTAEGATKSRRVMPGDFVLSNSMSFGRPYISKIEGYIHDGWLAIGGFREYFDPDFLYHLLRSAPVQAEFNRRAGAGTVRNLNADIVKSVSVHVPAIEEQRRIVKLLDKFESLTNSVSEGLPAEIAARRKQYEYYRDKLLSFENLAA